MPRRSPSPDEYPKGFELGKYKILALLGKGGFARVYRAHDTVEGRDVALKVPHEHLLKDGLKELLREVRITGGLDHPNILQIRNAMFVGNRLVIAYPLGERSLATRLRHRISAATVLDFTSQILDAVAYAHARRIIHCDINPDNVILFPGPSAKLIDFGIARFAMRTRVAGSGSGTLGYVAPEQAMGHPSFRSDVFSLGLLTYRMLAGQLPRWPYEWPLPGLDRVRRKVTPDFIAFLRKALTVEERRRFRDAGRMKQAFDELVDDALR
ncbi:MAG: serine/threonine protein kinase [Myxococcales bacterium]|nr:serine/threonine protein kinase [Myxococcales bacterium]